MMNTACCFTGHRTVAKGEQEALCAAVRRTVLTLLQKGVTEYRVGGALGFDMLAAEELYSLREDFPQLQIHIYVPCMQQERFYDLEQKRRYQRHLDAADRVICLSMEYNRQCMLARNRAMVDGSAFCISYLRRGHGGTAYTVRYAQQNGCKVIAL